MNYIKESVYQYIRDIGAEDMFGDESTLQITVVTREGDTLIENTNIGNFVKELITNCNGVQADSLN